MPTPSLPPTPETPETPDRRACRVRRDRHLERQLRSTLIDVLTDAIHPSTCPGSEACRCLIGRIQSLLDTTAQTREFRALTMVETAERFATYADRLLIDPPKVEPARRILALLIEETRVLTASLVRDPALSERVTAAAARAVRRVYIDPERNL